MAQELTSAQRVAAAIDWCNEHVTTSTRHLAEKMHYSPATLSLIRNGRIAPGFRFAHTLSEASGGYINADWILRGNGDMLNETPSSSTMHSQSTESSSQTSFASRLELLQKVIITALSEFTLGTGVTVTDITVIPYEGLKFGFNTKPVADYKQLNTVLSEALKSMQEKRAAPEPTNLPDAHRIVDIEELVLSQLLINPSHMERYENLNSDIIFSPDNSNIFDAMRELYYKDKTFDIMSLVGYLNDAYGSALEWLSVLEEISKKAMSDENIDAHIQALIKVSMRA